MSEEKINLTPEEIKEKCLKIEILRVSYEYEVWLQNNAVFSNFSTFCDDFGYTGKNRKYIFEAIIAIRKDASVSASEISKLGGVTQ